MGYRFVKLKDENRDITYPWKFECDSFDKLAEHNVKYMKKIITDGFKDFMDAIRNNYTGHYRSSWRQATEARMQGTGEGFLMASTQIEIEMAKFKMKSINETGAVYLSDNGSYFPKIPEFVVVNEVVRDELIYPDYSNEDIRVIKWDGGKHYYAKIGNMDVTDDYGNVKWNTEKRAREIAESALAKINL